MQEEYKMKGNKIKTTRQMKRKQKINKQKMQNRIRKRKKNKKTFPYHAMEKRISKQKTIKSPSLHFLRDNSKKKKWILQSLCPPFQELHQYYFSPAFTSSHM